MMRRKLGVGLVLSSVLAASPLAAQPAEGSVVRTEGQYGGVRPGAGPDPSTPSSAKSRRAPAKKSLLWIGFTAKEGGASELFFRAAEPFGVSQRLEGSTLVVLLEGLRSQARNTRRPLDTRFFETSLARVTTRKVGAKRARKGVAGRPAGIEVRIVFKDARDAREGSLRTDTGSDKMFYAYLGFGPSSAPATAAPPTGSGGTMEDPE
jgi:hypothetical protein